MSKLHVVGIGGTGHKLITSVIHLAACGAFKGQLGSNQIDQIRIVTIDADDSNGNLSLARTALSSYQQFYNAVSADTGLGLIPIESVTPTTNISLFKDGKRSISETFNIPQYKTQDIDKFIRFLYTDEEIDAEFNQGFYGHTSIGTLVVKDILSHEKTWTQFKTEINANDFVVVLGSIFGGTGASAIPVVLDELKAKKKDAESKLATVMLTPYFKTVGDIAEAGALQPNSDNFQTKAKASLYYYYDQNQYKKTDALYVIGEPEVNFSNEVASRGASNQRNKAHPIELFAVSAIVDFIKEAKFGREDVDVTKIITADRESDGKSEYYYTWKMVQNVDSGLPLKMQTLMKTAVFYNKVLYGQIKDGTASGTWQNNYDKEMLTERDDNQNLVYENIRAYLAQFVNWIYDLHKRNLNEIDQNSNRMKWTPDTRVKLFNAAYKQLFDNVPVPSGDVDKFSELVYNDANPKKAIKIYSDLCSKKPSGNTGKRFASLFALLGELINKKELFGEKPRLVIDNFTTVPYLAKENNTTFTRPDADPNKLWSKSEATLLINIADGLPNVQSEKFAASDVSIPSPWSIFIINELTLTEPKFAALNKLAYNQWCGLIALLVLSDIQLYNKHGLELKQLDMATAGDNSFLKTVVDTLVPTSYIFDNRDWANAWRVAVDDETIAFLAHNTIVCPAFSYSAAIKSKLHRMAPSIVDESGKFLSPDNYFSDQSQSANRDAKWALKLFLDSLKGIITNEASRNPRPIIKALQNLVEKFTNELGKITPNNNITMPTGAVVNSVHDLFAKENKIDSTSEKEYPFKLVDTREGVTVALVGLNVCGISSSNAQAATIFVTPELLYNRINAGNIYDIIRDNSRDDIILVYDQELLLDSMILINKNGEIVFHAMQNSRSSVSDYEVIWPINQKLLTWFSREQLNKMLSVRIDPDKVTVTLEFKLQGTQGKTWSHTVSKEYKLKTATDESRNSNESGVCLIVGKDILPLWAVWPYKEVHNSKSENVWKRYNFFTVDYNDSIVTRGASILEIEPFFADGNNNVLGKQKLSTISTPNNDIHYRRFKTLPSAFQFNLKTAEKTSYVGAVFLQEPTYTSQGNTVWNIGFDFGTTTTTAFYNINGAGSTPEFLQVITEYDWVDGDANPRKYVKKNDMVILSNASDKKSSLDLYFIDPQSLRQKSYTTAYERMDTSKESVEPTIFDTGRIFWHNVDNFRLLNSDTEGRRDRLLTNIKWETGKINAGKYLNQLLTQMVYTAAEKGVQKINWFFSYPTAFSREARKEFSASLSRLISGLQEESGITIVFNEKTNLITESIAAAFYFGKNNKLQSTFLCVDIGGNSSDISFWVKNDNVFQTSIRFASRDMFIAPLEKLLSRPTVMDTVRTPDPGDGIHSMLEYGGKNSGFSKDKIKYFIETVLFEYYIRFKDRLDSLEGDDKQAYKKFKYSVSIAYSGLVFYLANIISALLKAKKIDNDITQIVFGLSGKGSKLTDWIAYCPEIYDEAQHLIAEQTKGIEYPDGIQIRFLDQFNKEAAKTETAIGMICDLDDAGNQKSQSKTAEPEIFMGSTVDVTKSGGLKVHYEKDAFIDPYTGDFVNPESLKVTVEKDLADFGVFIDFFNRVAGKSRGDMPLISKDWYEKERQTLWKQIERAFENTLGEEKRFDPPFIIILKVFLEFYGNTGA